jgi:signal transduction histidine kinase
LVANVSDLLPEVNLEPVRKRTPLSQIRLNRLLAALPAQLIVPDAAAEPAPLSPIRLSLILAWGSLILATGAVAIVLKGVLTLSERRGAFVSAVTHELRTPLTTFRMYAEMLAEGMVSGAEKQREYLKTLHAEANRLSHLVENVLSFARLERGRQDLRREPTALGALLDRVAPRLEQRAEDANMKLQWSGDPAARETTLRTDPAVVEQVLFNLVDNACKYAAAGGDRRIHLQWELDDHNMRIRIRDHGPGISPREAKRLFRPFSKSAHDAAMTAPGVGLGLALCRRMARELGGELQFDAPADGGAAFVLRLPCG